MPITLQRGRKGKKFKSKAEVTDDIIDDSDSSGKSVNESNLSVPEKKSNKKAEKSEKNDSKKADPDNHEQSHHHHHHHKTEKDKKKKKVDEKKKKGKAEKKAGPMHFTANNEPVAISQDGEFEGELPEEVFKEVRVVVE